MSEPSADAPAGSNAVAEQCAFPGCEDPREPKKDPSAPGPAPKFCVRPDHNAGAKWRAERKAKAGSRTDAVEEVETDKPVTDAAVNAVNVREQVIVHVKGLLRDLPRYVDLMQTISDPEAAEAQVLAVESEAATRVAQAEARADQERTAKIAAQSAKQAAEDEKAAADQAASQIADELEAARAQFDADVEQIRAAAKAEVQEARDLQEEKRQEAERLVEDARQKAETHVNAARQGAADEIKAIRDATAREVKAAQDAAGKAEVAAARLVEEMTRELEAAQAAATAQVNEANSSGRLRSSAPPRRTRTAGRRSGTPKAW